MKFTHIADTKFVVAKLNGKNVYFLKITEFELKFGLNHCLSENRFVVFQDKDGNFKIYKNEGITLMPLNEDITAKERDIRVKFANNYYKIEMEIKRWRLIMKEKNVKITTILSDFSSIMPSNFFSDE